MTMTHTNTDPAVTEGAVQLRLAFTLEDDAFNEAELMAHMTADQLLEFMKARIEKLQAPAEIPMIRVHAVPPTSDPPTGAPRPKTQRVSGERSRRGRYVDLTGKLREVPDLCAITLMGIATAEDALNRMIPPTADGLAKIARDASAYRNKQGIGGPNICVQTAEFILRVLRRIRLEPPQLSILTPEALVDLLNTFIARHALDVEITTPLRTAGGE